MPSCVRSVLVVRDRQQECACRQRRERYVARLWRLVAREVVAYVGPVEAIKELAPHAQPPHTTVSERLGCAPAEHDTTRVRMAGTLACSWSAAGSPARMRLCANWCRAESSSVALRATADEYDAIGTG